MVPTNQGLGFFPAVLVIKQWDRDRLGKEKEKSFILIGNATS